MWEPPFEGHGHCGSLNEARSSHGMGLITYNNTSTVIVVGGNRGNSDYLKSVEFWDSNDESWSMHTKKLKEKKSSFAFATVPEELICSSPWSSWHIIVNVEQ